MSGGRTYIAWLESGGVVCDSRAALLYLEQGVEVSEVTGMKRVRNIIMHADLLEVAGCTVAQAPRKGGR